MFVKRSGITAEKLAHMIVYRFEKNGIGPYVSGRSMKVGTFARGRSKTITQKKSESYFKNQYANSNTNGLEAWKKAHGNKKYMFGCSNKKQLRAYFAGDFKQLFKEGYRIKRYKVPDEEVINMVVEVAFPVKYHKLQSVRKVRQLAAIY